MFSRLTRLASGGSKLPTHGDETEQVSLSDLNGLLEVLTDIFPQHEVALLRELLLAASHESRLHIAANALVQNPHRYAQNRRLDPGHVHDWEKFRSTKYKRTVEKLLVTEYQGLAKSTIRNVLSENNHDYVRSRNALSDIASKSWRFNLTAWISRRQAPPPKPYLDVTRRPTGCVRLNDEIYALGHSERLAQSERDEKLAREVNEAEYKSAHALFECECCFGDCTWEDMAVCTEGHFFCRECLDRSIKEALYGQGNCLLREKWSVRCISSVANPACEGFVAPVLLPHALPSDTLNKMEERFARDGLQGSGLQLVQCPGCSYAAVDQHPSARLRPWAVIALAFLAVCIIYICVQLSGLIGRLTKPAILFFLLLLCICIHPTELRVIYVSLSDTIGRVRRRKMGVRQVFKCENPRCGMTSCSDCGKAWAAFHDCRRAEFDNQRLFVERAMSEAVKRTCPECRTSFVKSDGCNKLTCPCGYEMCYICRVDIRAAGYSHFCQHFRAVAGTACRQCDRCNLYQTEDEQAVVATAARRAATEWAASRARDDVMHVANAARVERSIRRNRVWLPWLERYAEGFVGRAFEW